MEGSVWKFWVLLSHPFSERVISDHIEAYTNFIRGSSKSMYTHTFPQFHVIFGWKHMIMSQTKQ